jgi:hypothetical protein
MYFGPLKMSGRLQRFLISILLAVSATSILSVSQLWLATFQNSDGFSQSGGAAVGGDFACFYAAGEIYNKNRLQLYDPEHQQQIQRKIFAGRVVEFNDLLFVYPPIVAAGFAYLARLPFFDAYLVWSLVSLSLFTGALLILSAELKLKLGAKILLLTVGLGFVPYSINTVAAGQLSAVGLMILVLVGAALSRARYQLAGALFALTYYKPPIFFLLLIYLSVRHGWKFVRGFLMGASILVAITAAIVPASIIQANLELMMGYHYGSTTSFGHVHWPKHGAGLLALLTMLSQRQYLESWILFFVAATLLIFVWFRADASAERRGLSNELRYSFAIACSMFLSIQMVAYDLTLLLIPMAVFLRALNGVQVSLVSFGLMTIGVAAIYLEFIGRSFKFGTFGDALATPAAFTLFLIGLLSVIATAKSSEDRAANSVAAP